MYLVLLSTEVKSGSISWDPQCTTKYPDCLGSDYKIHTNIACKTVHCGPKRKDCLETTQDAEFPRAMVDLHNEKRQLVASGTETRLV